MVLKGIEYKAKLEHQAVRMDDFAIIEGHAHYAVIGDDGNLAHSDTKLKAKKMSASGAKPFKPTPSFSRLAPLISRLRGRTAVGCCS